MLKSFVHRLGAAYNARLCLAEFRDQGEERKNERSIEYRFLFECLTDFRPSFALDVGTGRTALPSLIRSCGIHTTALDNIVDYWPRGMVNRHYHVMQEDITRPRLAKRFDFISCISVLEHITSFDEAVAGMFSLLNPGGHLLLTFPFNERKYVEDAYELPASSYGKGSAYTCQIYSRNEINQWIATNRAEIVKEELWEFFTGELWTEGEVLPFPRLTDKSRKHHLMCLALRKK